MNFLSAYFLSYKVIQFIDILRYGEIFTYIHLVIFKGITKNNLTCSVITRSVQFHHHESKYKAAGALIYYLAYMRSKSFIKNSIIKKRNYS